MRFMLFVMFATAVPIAAAAARFQPDGSGDPKETSCMTGEKPTGSSVPLRICYTNAQWAELKADFIVIGPDGRPMLSADAPPGTKVIGADGKPLLWVNDPRNIHSQICTRQYTGGPSANMAPNFNTICDNTH
jgi:hypothetical protein